MSEQADALQAKLRREGILVDDPSAANNFAENDGGGAALPDKVWVKLPGPHSIISEFATKLGAVAKFNGIFRREREIVTIDRETKLLADMDPERFISYVESAMNVSTGKEKRVTHSDGQETIVRTPQSMEAKAAKLVLKSDDFIYQQRPLMRSNRVRLPVTRANGVIELLPEGYDVESRTWTERSGIEYDESMTLPQAKAVLDGLHSEFPLGDWDSATGLSLSKAVSIAAMLTMFGPHLQGLTEPRMNFWYTANSVGSGKTLLSSLAVIPVMGEVETQTMPANDEELRKLLDTHAMSASPCIYFDDVRGYIASTVLNGFMTAEWWTGRALGGNKKFKAPKVSVVFLTGNGLTLSPDLARRSLKVDLYVEVADVQARKIKHIIDVTHLSKPEVRRDILSALWTLVKHWVSVGRPKAPGGRMLQGFSRWCEIFGGIVAAAGYGDPCAEPKEDGDQDGSDMALLVATLLEEMDEKGKSKMEFEFSELAELICKMNLFEWYVEVREIPRKEKDLAGEVIFEMAQKSKTKLGLLMSKTFGGRVFAMKDGRFVRWGQRGNRRTRRYQVEVLEAKTPALPAVGMTE